jgi:hypothetical protein
MIMDDYQDEAFLCEFNTTIGKVMIRKEDISFISESNLVTSLPSIYLRDGKTHLESKDTYENTIKIWIQFP